MDVYIDVAIEVTRQPEMMRARADVGERSLRRLLHHVAELAGRRHLALAVQHLYFGLEDRTTHLCPGKAGDETDLVLLGVAELWNAEQVLERRRCHLLNMCRISDDTTRHLAANVAYLALEVANAALTRVVTNDLAQRIVVEGDLRFGETRRLALLAHEILARNLEL